MFIINRIFSASQKSNIIYLLLFLSIYLSSCSSEFGEKPQSEIEACGALSNKGWTMVDYKGRGIVKNVFSSAPSAVVEERFTVAGPKGVSLYSSETGEAIDSAKNMIMIGVSVEGLIPAVRGGERITILNKDGSTHATLNPVNGREVTESDPWYADGMLRVVDAEGRVGFFNSKGEPQIAPKYAEATAFSKGVAAAKNKAGWVIIDHHDRVKGELPLGYYPTSEEWSEGYLAISDGRKYAIVNTSGEVINTGADIDSIGQITKKYFIFKKGETFGLRNLKGEQLLPAEYLNLFPISPSRLMAHLPSGQWAVINYDGKVKKEIHGVESIVPIGSMKFGFKGRMNGKVVIVDKSGNIRKNTDFNALESAIAFSDVIISDYADSDALKKEIRRLITDKGIAGVRPGDEIAPLVKKDPADLLNALSFTLADIGPLSSGELLRVNLISDAFIATESAGKPSLNADAVVESVVLTISATTDSEAVKNNIVMPVIEEMNLQNAQVNVGKEGVTVTISANPDSQNDDSLLAEQGLLSDSNASTIYRVLLFSSSDEQELPESNSRTLPDPVRLYRDGIYLYCAGNFADKGAADRLCADVMNRYSGARVIAFRNGRLLNYRSVPSLDRRKMPDHHIITDEELQAL